MQKLQKFKKTIIGNIPEEWELKEFQDIADIKGGKRLPLGEKFSEIKTPYPYIRVSDFKNGGIDQTNLQFLTENTYKKIKNYIIRHEDVYISIAGTIGLAGLIPRELDGANLTENAAKIINLKNIKKEFLVYLFNSYIIQKQIQSHIGQVSQPKLALFRIEKIKIPLPAIDEQQKIASILSNVDELIQKTEQIIEQTQRLKKALMQRLLTK
jgi:type I restriction enzyme, S subunit